MSVRQHNNNDANIARILNKGNSSNVDLIALKEMSFDRHSRTSSVIKLGAERNVISSNGYTNTGYMDHEKRDVSVLDELQDFEINPSAPQILTKKIIKTHVQDFLNLNKHPERVLPIWRDSLKINTVGIPDDTEQAKAYSKAINKMSLLCDTEVRHVDKADKDLNVMVLFMNGKEQLCLDERYNDALEAVNMDSRTIYERIEKNLVYDKQATEYRFLQYSEAGASFFLYIVDVGWIERLEKTKQEKAAVFTAQLLNVAFRIFSLQEGIADSVKYSHMNHKYFWKRLNDYAPIDKTFMRVLYGKKMRKARSKQQAAKCLAYYMWKEVSRLGAEEIPEERLTPLRS